jgi:hypothetical protein
MASSKHYSAIVGVEDVAHLMAAFEELNSCILSLCIETTQRQGRYDLTMIVTAYTVDPVSAARVPLASSQLSMLSQGYKAMEAAITYCLYRIDAQLAELEFAKTRPKA